MDTKLLIDNGVKWLNENGPAEWWNRIDLETLDLEDPNNCVLGQVFAADAYAVGISCGYIYAQKFFTEHGGLAYNMDDQAWQDWSDMIHECGFLYNVSTDEWRAVVEGLSA